MVKPLCFHSPGFYYTVVDPTPIFSLEIFSFTDIDEWWVYVYGN
jgi:hypothetical protein